MEKQLNKYVAKPGYADHPAFVETFHEDFARVVRAYAGHHRVFVFIDDLDRCDVPKAAELMQAINLMIGELGNLVFVLGMDREKSLRASVSNSRTLSPSSQNTKPALRLPRQLRSSPSRYHLTPSATDKERQADAKAGENVTNTSRSDCPCRDRGKLPSFRVVLP